jgi:hypothetical protein
MLDENEIIETMQWVVDDILIPHFMQLGLDATGEWREYLNVRADGQVGTINGRKYTEQLVYGRMPGAMPPIAPLERWAQVKLGLQGSQAKSAAFAIAKKIAREGTNIYKDGGTDLLEILETPEVQKKITQRFQGLITTKVKLMLEREIQQAWQQ